MKEKCIFCKGNHKSDECHIMGLAELIDLL